jgi:mannose-6-phosphate isomerase-like protein (cupin superfamily)
MELGAPEPNPAELPGVKANEGYDSSEDYVAIPIEGCGAISGVVEGVTFYPLGRALGTSAFGLGEFVIEAHGESESNYPRHTHAEDDQDEVYVVATGSGFVEAGDERIALSVGEMIRIAPEVVRKWHAGDVGVRVIAIGAPAGKPYESNKPTIV